MTKAEYIAILEARTVTLEAQNVELTQQVNVLEGKVVALLKVLEKKGVKKDSRNSHTAPSGDKSKPKRNKSLRKKSTRKTGGQKGHEGHTLKMTDTPDSIAPLRSDFCSVCGSSLKEGEHHLLSKRQEVILPPVKPKITEYQQYGCVCGCGHHQKADYPATINAPIQYSSDIVALVSYFNVFQYVPYGRLKLLFEDIFKVSMSEGSIKNMLERGATRAEPVYEAILGNIKQSKYVGSDETGVKVNGKKWWVWVWQNVENTFIKACQTRGFAAVEEVLPDGLPNATIGSDRWAAQLKTVSKAKQLCLAHLLRDLNYLLDVEQHPWAQQFKALLQQAISLKHFSLERNKAFAAGEAQAQALEAQLNELLAVPLLKEQVEWTAKFQTQMLKNRNHLFTFLYQLEVPPDNNGSERAIRNIKVKQKISGQFKSGQQNFCVLRSVIDTLRKRQLNVLECLQFIMAHPLPE